ncbi:MAG: leucine-rich repeat domain-containing protein [Eubacteriales bacterium]|nr:leucine-rich repeat domain-containing protein [Eubacteriales bacterium]
MYKRQVINGVTEDDVMNGATEGDVKEGLVFSPNTTVKIPRYEDVDGKDKYKDSWVAENSSRSNSDSDSNKGGIHFWSNLVVIDADGKVLDFGYDRFDAFTMDINDLKSVLKDKTGKDYVNFRLKETDAIIDNEITVLGRTEVLADVYVSHKVTFEDRHGNPIVDIYGNPIELQKETGSKLNIADIRKTLISKDIEFTGFELDLNSDSIDITEDTTIKVLYDYDWKVEADKTVTITGIYNNKSKYDIPEKIGKKDVKAIGDGQKAIAVETTAKDVTISSETVTKINANAFSGVSKLKSLTIDNVKSIGEGAFVGTTGLTRLELKN